MTKNFIKVLVSISVVFGTLSCSKNKEQDDLALAQKCMNEVPDGSPDAAGACLQYIEKYSDQQASILKCSIWLNYGGFTNSKMVKAYNIFADASQTNKTTAFMTVLTLDNPDINTGYTRAQTADTYCRQSGVLGLVYISGLILAGTAMSQTMAAVVNGGSSTPPIDLSDPNAVKSAVTTFLTDCAKPVPDATCPSAADLATIGGTVASLADSYCNTSGANTDVCGQVNDAIDAAGGSSAAMGQALLCYMNHKTFNTGTGQCNP